ncbi:MAG: MopE-related protein, partial [Myxococcota bacterium]
SVDASDCNDDDPFTFVGATTRELSSSCTTDADGDGWGASRPAEGAVAGRDCDDADAAAFPGAPERFGDGQDQDCVGGDLWELVDGFEQSSLDPAVWSDVVDAQTVGSSGLALSGQGYLHAFEGWVTTIPVDATECASLNWEIWADRNTSGTFRAMTTIVQFYDGQQWVDTAAFDELHVPGYQPLRGSILDPAAFHDQLMVRIVTIEPGQFGRTRYDDFRLACPGVDADGDGIGVLDDCDDTDARHWSDCGACVDVDDDGYGDDCDLGEDCDDRQAMANPAGTDLGPNGIDEDCNGVDQIGWADGFEDRERDRDTWDSMRLGTHYYPTFGANGSLTSLALTADAMAISTPRDTSSCEALYVEAWVMRLATEDADRLVLEYFDGSDWASVFEVAGGRDDMDFRRYSTVIDDPTVLRTDLQIRMRTAPGDNDLFYVDDVVAVCSEPDGDGDGRPANLDCDDADARHWSDCGACLDADDDGFGVGCDLGADCRDDDASIFPTQSDAFGDGVDNDCDGFDGQALVDGFELGEADDRVWDTAPQVTPFSAHTGSHALDMDFNVEAITVPIDTSTCPAVLWQLWAARGWPAPDPFDTLDVAYDAGSGWQTVDRWAGNDIADGAFTLRRGVIDDPAAMGPDFRLRVSVSGLGTRTFYADDVVVACTEPDVDGDGLPSAVDCDPADPLHWSDCGACVDVDGDGYGFACDMGQDCAESDAAVHPYAPDAFGDGADTDCSGLDGPGWADNFDSGFFIGAWAPYEGTVILGTEEARSLPYGVQFGGQGQLVSYPWDTSTCSSVSYAFSAQRGFFHPDIGEDFVMSWDGGGGWVEAHRVLGGDLDQDFVVHSGTITDPAALSPDFRIRLWLDADHDWTDELHLDDVSLHCD